MKGLLGRQFLDFPAHGSKRQVDLTLIHVSRSNSPPFPGQCRLRYTTPSFPGQDTGEKI